MMRLVSISARDRDLEKVAEDLQPGVAGLLRVELHAEDVVALDRRRERVGVRRRGDAVRRDRRRVRVREVDLRAAVEAAEQARRPREVERVPADVRNLQPLLGVAVAAARCGPA